jgi:hypothetical protein
VDSIDALNPCATQFDPEGVGGLFDSIERSISGSISVPEVLIDSDLDCSRGVDRFGSR